VDEDSNTITRYPEGSQQVERELGSYN
jgi:hypothetical protein